ncbi:MAG: IPT/TIG domain-containing protein [Pseudonocardiaceae bacterium]
MKIDSITPDSALPGTPLLIKGDGLDAADKLLFGDEPAPFKVGATGSIEADVPNGSGTVDVMFAREDGDTSNSVSFTFLEVY